MSRQIIMTEPDRVKLQKMIKDILLSEVDGTAHVRALDAELRRAVVLPAGQVPPDVITMHSRALLSFGDGEDEAYTLVYPEEADMSENLLSVLSPVGTAILGYRAGDVIDWEVPSGTLAIHVKRVDYQPEAAGDER
jgi:regulator of nucleoside diphosphate kinase